MNTRSRGTIAVYVILMSTSLFIVLVASLQQASVIFTSSQERYYLRMAEEAAEAGTAYASACLGLNSHHQTWGTDYYGGGGADRPDLTPSSDCNGTVNAFPSNTYVYSDTGMRTRFVVGQLGSGSLDNSSIISAIGYTELLSGGSVVKTYQAGVKKTITWDQSAVSQLSTSGFYRTCGIVDSSAYCWGNNENGQLGDGTYDNSLIPVAVKRESYPAGIGNHAVIGISATTYSNCIIIDTGEVYCWGYNGYGELGNGTQTTSTVPVKVSALSGKNVVQLGSSSYSMCARTDTGELYCWGRGDYGQIGNNTTNTRQLTPVLVAGPTGGFGDLANKTVSYVAPNAPYFGFYMCAVASGEAYCWGDNKMGQLGINTTDTNKTVPTAVYTGGVLSGKTVTRVALDGRRSTDTTSTLGTSADGDSATCALAYTSTPADAKVYCWGSNLYGQVGNNGVIGTSSNYFPAWIYRAPQAVYTGGVLNGKTISEIAVADRGGCAVGYTGGDLSTRRLYCWGQGRTRGTGSTSTTTVPVAVTDTYTPSVFANNPVYGITGGAHRMCAIVNATSYCWGSNGVGQIGDGTTVNPRLQPTEALFLRTKGNEYIY